MIGTHQIQCLTSAYLAFILSPLSPHVTVRALTPGTGQDIRPLLSVVFLRPPKSNAGLIRLLFFMVGCVEQLFIELAGACTSSEKLDTFRHPTFSLVAGGNPLFTGLPA